MKRRGALERVDLFFANNALKCFSPAAVALLLGLLAFDCLQQGGLERQDKNALP